jgi:branched-chain amino acid transport system permease protein
MVTRMMILAIFAMSLDLLQGVTGLVSLGHAAYFGLGGYVVGIAAFHLANDVPIFGWAGSNEALVVWPLAMLVSGFAALLIGALSLRTSGVYFIMITLAFAQMFFFLFVALKTYGGDDGLTLRRRSTIPGIAPRDDVAFFYVCLAALVLVLLLLRRVAASRFGTVLDGIRQNERRMMAIGLSPFPYKLAAFVLSAGLAGLAGATKVIVSQNASLTDVRWEMSGEVVLMTLVGGLGTIFGPVVGAFIIIAMQQYLAGFGQWVTVIQGVIFVVCVLTFRRGVVGEIAHLFKRSL